MDFGGGIQTLSPWQWPFGIDPLAISQDVLMINISC
jgi:hypothetical protein